MITSPTLINKTPTKRKRIRPKNGGSTRQCEILQGTQPAMNPGAMNRKIVEPMTASVFLITSSCKQVAWTSATEITQVLQPLDAIQVNLRCNPSLMTTTP